MKLNFLAVLNFFLVQKLIFGHFWNCEKWNLVEIFFREIDLFDFTSFLGLDILKFSGPLRCWDTIFKFSKKIIVYSYLFRELDSGSDSKKQDREDSSLAQKVYLLESLKDQFQTRMVELDTKADKYEDPYARKTVQGVYFLVYDIQISNCE